MPSALEAFSRRVPGGDARPVAAPSGKLLAWPGRAPRIGVIHNARARHNIGRPLPLVIAGCEHVMPLTHQELHDVLADFVATGLDALIIDGGDGTVRDILSVMARYFPGFAPRIALVPSGKTNALALDLGVPMDWTIAQAIDASGAEDASDRRLQWPRGGDVDPGRRGADDLRTARQCLAAR